MNFKNQLVEDAYKDFTPSVNVKKTVQILLEYVPREDTAHLQSIILTNTAALSRGRRRQKSSSGASIPFVAGLYHRTWKGNPAYIEIFVDNILSRAEKYELWFTFFRNLLFATVLYHEIGHHVQYMSKSKLVSREAYAEKYATHLKRHFVQRRYWYVKKIYWLLKKVGVVRLITRGNRKFKRPFSSNRNVSKPSPGGTQQSLPSEMRAFIL